MPGPTFTTSDAQTSIKNYNAELFKLYPNTLIHLYEIDLGQILFDKGILSRTELNSNEKIFRFHNNVKISVGDIRWNEKTYQLCPIETEGFEYSSKGAAPTPKIRLTVNDQGILALSLLKKELYNLGDLTGSKLTRIRTFLKFLPRTGNESIMVSTNEVLTDDDSTKNAFAYSQEVYFIDRKSQENKYTIEYELSTIFDLEGIKLPGRLVLSNICPFQYRGEGCCYETYKNRTSKHGNANLPEFAPPIATERDEIIYKDESKNEPGIIDVQFGRRAIEEYQKNKTNYVIGDCVFIVKNGIFYYYVAKKDNPPFAQ